MRIAVSGSRLASMRHENYIKAMLFDFHEVNHIGILLNGGANGVDRIAQDWALRYGIVVETYIAEWARLGRAAGPKRNQDMVDSGIDFWMAFPLGSSIGTNDFITKAKDAGIPGEVYPLDSM
jgi:YspA, cpYpsA-related SLOG family